LGFKGTRRLVVLGIMDYKTGLNKPTDAIKIIFALIAKPFNDISKMVTLVCCILLKEFLKYHCCLSIINDLSILIH
jgi:hypothetical protein